MANKKQTSAKKTNQTKTTTKAKSKQALASTSKKTKNSQTKKKPQVKSINQTSLLKEHELINLKQQELNDLKVYYEQLKSRRDELLFFKDNQDLKINDTDYEYKQLKYGEGKFKVRVKPYQEDEIQQRNFINPNQTNQLNEVELNNQVFDNSYLNRDVNQQVDQVIQNEISQSIVDNQIDNQLQEELNQINEASQISEVNEVVQTNNINNQSQSTYAVEMIDICKSFLNGKVVANDKINLRVKHNEVHVIIGENGAGKSTLMSILFGIYSPDSGSIKINGKNVFFSSAKDASAAGLGMVHQHFKLIPTYSVFENIILGSEEVNKFGLLKTIKPKKKVESLIKQYKFNLNPNIKISNLSVGQQQKTEILKLLYQDAEILIFDEPTAVLSLDEIEQFLNMIRQLKAEGKTIILITHKFAEIKSVADRATIIRNGKFISEFNVKDKTIEEMANDMVGKKVEYVRNESSIPFGDVILSVRNLKINNSGLANNLTFLLKNNEVYKLRFYNQQMLKINKKLVDQENLPTKQQQDELTKQYQEYANKCEQLKQQFRAKYQTKIDYLKQEIDQCNSDDRKIENKRFKLSQVKSILFNFNKEFSSSQKIKTINFDIHSGEVFAIAGVEGNGQSELALILSGLLKNKNAEIHLLNKDISNLSVNKRYKAGMSYVPEDRHRYGLILDENIYMNFVLNRINEQPNSKFGFINEAYIKENARQLIKKFDVRGTTRGTAPARLLSGGNQQKIIIARELTNEHKLIIMVQPTRGLDLGAIEYIHKKVLEEKNKGNAILLISYELDEILALADTIAIIYNGSFIGLGPREQMNAEKIGKLMAGEV